MEGVLSIDHIAAPIGWPATARHVVAAKGGVRLSDYDAYFVDLQSSAVDPTRGAFSGHDNTTIDAQLPGAARRGCGQSWRPPSRATRTLWTTVGR